MDRTREVYEEAARSGKYIKISGLIGKYDNVRRCWEDEITRIAMRPFLEELIEEKGGGMEGLRILDLGCGSGDGFELLCGVNAGEPSLVDHEVNLIGPETLGAYHGVDISEPLLQQAIEVHGCNSKLSFQLGDFSRGLPVPPHEEPYDVYFASYGTLSHLKDEELLKLLIDMAGHAGDGSLLICDWLGRYSYEWQSLWQLEEEPDYSMDYVVSYIYPEEERAEKELDHLILRLVSPREISALVHKASEEAGRAIELKSMFDRSILVGRHMDTADYNRHCRPLRAAVNSLFETNMRTDLDALMTDYHPREGFEEINHFLESFQTSWNALVRHTIELLHHYHSRAGVSGLSGVPSSCPEEVRGMMRYMEDVVRSCHWIKVGDTRANIIEPQLGYALRELEFKVQRGLGCGHGLVGIYRVIK